jgi:hypothetical protein
MFVQVQILLAVQIVNFLILLKSLTNPGLVNDDEKYLSNSYSKGNIRYYATMEEIKNAQTLICLKWQA